MRLVTLEAALAINMPPRKGLHVIPKGPEQHHRIEELWSAHITAIPEKYCPSKGHIFGLNTCQRETPFSQPLKLFCARFFQGFFPFRSRKKAFMHIVLIRT